PPGWGANTWNAPTQTRILRSKTVYPRGMSGPCYTTTITHESIQTFANASSFERCGIIQWFRITNPDGSYQRHAICASTFWAPQLGPTLDSELFAEETYTASGQLVEGTYYGNNGAIGDGATTPGTLYVAFETASMAPASTLFGNFNTSVG